MPDAAPVSSPAVPESGFNLDDFDTILGDYDSAPPEPAPQAPPRQATQARAADLQDLDPEPPAEGEEAEPPDDQQPDQQAEDDIALAAKAKDWADRPDIPDEFLDKLGVAKVDGEEHQITVREAFEGYQRRAVTTQRLQEASAIKQHYEQLIGGQRQMFQRWQNPESLESELEDQNLGPQLDAIVKRRFRDFAQEQSILDSIQDPNHKAFAARQFQEKKQAMMMARAREREARLANERAQHNDGQQQHDALVQRTTNQMAQLGPRAIRDVGLKNTPYVRSLIGREVRSLHKWGTDLTYELVLEAAKTAKDVWDAEHERAITKAAEGRVRSKALLPRRASPNPSSGPAKPPTSKRQFRLDEFDDVMKEYDQGR
jgi:hypothetical protein